LRERRQQYYDEKGRFRLRRFLGLAFGPDSPVPRWQDLMDIINHMKWFVGLGSRPKFDRFTYWEKFDYMAVFWGVAMIGVSGLIMWFPAAFTLVLPGWAINVAQIIHSDEALLAAGFIFTFHFFNSHFRPEKFPFDSVMFSGHQTEEELREERPALYERMAQSGELERYATLGEWRAWKPILTVFGATAILAGLALSAVIFWALLR
jgi:cytochrome b subunit of formate dehydrogenase